MNVLITLPNQAQLVVPDETELAIVRDGVATTAFPAMLRPNDHIVVRSAGFATEEQSADAGREVIHNRKPLSS